LWIDFNSLRKQVNGSSFFLDITFECTTQSISLWKKLNRLKLIRFLGSFVTLVNLQLIIYNIILYRGKEGQSNKKTFIERFLCCVGDMWPGPYDLELARTGSESPNADCFRETLRFYNYRFLEKPTVRNCHLSHVTQLELR
jgi:hypothetical protein